MCHVNLLKPYYASHVTDPATTDLGHLSDSCIKPVLLTDSCTSNDTVDLAPVSVTVSEEKDEIYPGDSVLQARLRNSEALSFLDDRLNHITDAQHIDLINLISEYVSLFPNAPSCTNLIEHDIDVGRFSSDSSALLSGVCK